MLKVKSNDESAFSLDSLNDCTCSLKWAVGAQSHFTGGAKYEKGFAIAHLRNRNVKYLIKAICTTQRKKNQVLDVRLGLPQKRVMADEV